MYIYKYTSLTGNDDFNNERTHFFIKIYLSHFIFKTVMFVVCERWVGNKDGLQYWPKFTSWPEQQHFFLILALVSQPCVTEGHKALSLQTGFHASILSPIDSKTGHLVILLSNIHLLLLFFRLFTQVHLLTDGSVKGKYITMLAPNRPLFKCGCIM